MPTPETPVSTASGGGGGGRGALLGCFLAACAAVLAAVLVATCRGVAFDAAPLPDDYTHHAISVPEHRSRGPRESERVGEGLLRGPEDLAYDAGTGFLYSGCEDGWIRRVKLRREGDGPAGEEVEEWAHVGGRPLGLAFGPGKQLVVADAYKGLLAVAEDGAVRLLSDQADGVRFALTDGVDVAADGAAYFTDASHKYNLSVHMLDILEGRPHGRLLRFDPATSTTTVLLRDLYFANGVAVSPDQASVVFCESLLRRCRRYYIAGNKRGTVERFMENLPGSPDNILYDGECHFWIGLSSRKSWFGEMVLKYPWVRKMLGMATLLLQMDAGVPRFLKAGGVLRASLEGEALALYTDTDMAMVTSGLKIGKHLYYGSVVTHHIGRIRLDKLLAADQ